MNAFDAAAGSPKSSNTRPLIGLALQGGAAHGAFTWGVLDRLLEEDIDICAISGASSGAFNTALVANGLAIGDKALAKATLEAGWIAMSKAADANWFAPFRSLRVPVLTPWGAIIPVNVEKDWPNLNNWMYQLLWQHSGHIPKWMHELPGANPILNIVREFVDFEAIQTSEILDVYVNAINGRTQKHTLFQGDALTAEAIAASANLPYIMPATHINGDEYWDGGYIYNPYFSPLANGNGLVTDIIGVMVNPIDQEEKCMSAGRSEQWLNGSVFSAGAMENWASIGRMNDAVHAFAQASDMSEVATARMVGKRHIRNHRIQFHVPEKAGPSSKFNLDPEWLQELRAIGYKTADQWLKMNGSKLGIESTFDPEEFARPAVMGQKVKARRQVAT